MATKTDYRKAVRATAAALQQDAKAALALQKAFLARAESIARVAAAMSTEASIDPKSSRGKLRAKQGQLAAAEARVARQWAKTYGKEAARAKAEAKSAVVRNALDVATRGR